MFFPKLRRHAKWMFLALAIVFAGSFVVFGVGSDVQGGLGELFRNAGVSSDAPSVEEARERVAENPRDAEALRELATALSTDAKTGEAIDTLTRYLALRPKDEDALRELAGLYLTRANRLSVEAEIVQARASYLTAGATFGSPLELPGGAAEQDPILDAITTKASAEVNAAYTAAQDAYRSAADTYDKVVALSPTDPGIQLDLAQTAQRAGDFPRAIAAYERYIELAPDDPLVPQVKRQVEQLKALGQTTVQP